MGNSALLGQVLLTFQTDFHFSREDLSAILLHGNYLWLGSDETATIERLSLIEHNQFANHQQFQVADFVELPNTSEQEVDIEGLDYSDSYLWLVGSHSSKRKCPRLELSDQENSMRLQTVILERNRHLLARIPVIDGQLVRSGTDPNDPQRKLTAASLAINNQGDLLTQILQTDPHLGIFVNSKIPGKDNGFDIEGIVVLKNRIFLGLRGPVLRGWAIILELEVKQKNSPYLELKKIGEQKERYKKHFVNLQGLGIRDLIINGEDLLILAGPTMDLDGPVKVFQLNQYSQLPDHSFSQPKAVLEISYGDRKDHAEGITLFSGITQLAALLVVYDSPAQARLQDNASILADIFQLSA
ncbi:MAG: DUF3616 domain-containing protein [Scytolyngbya sp. HA4215-MV1]|jgi:hypothetical protein|nr:DUF3616 domain-containing protein [Scytolyngbya sp. HA4215-MV1]